MLRMHNLSKVYRTHLIETHALRELRHPRAPRASS